MCFPKLVFLLSPLCLLSLVSSAAAFSRKDAGTASGEFLNLGVGARGTAMGEAYTALAEGVESLHWNVGGLRRLSRTEVQASYNRFVLETRYSALSLARPVGRGVLGAGILFMQYGDFQKLDVSGNPQGEFRAEDLAALFSYGDRWRDIFWGLSGKYIRSTIDRTHAQTFATDVGVLWRAGNGIRAGTALENLGSALKFQEESDPLPARLKVGAGKGWMGDRWIVSVEGQWRRRGQSAAALGAEWNFPWFYGRPSLRAGYNTRPNAVRGLEGISVGVGLAGRKLLLDYAWVPFGVFGDTHRFSFIYRL